MTADESTNIYTRQAQPDNLHLIRAFSRRYQMARRYSAIRDTTTLLLAAASPPVSIASADAATLLAAAAGLWLLADRLFVAKAHRQAIDKAVTAHELYDTTLFRLPWNTGLAGRRPDPEQLAEDAARHPEKPNYATWYADTGYLPRPVDVLLCQRQNSMWSLRLHDSFARFVIVAAVSWLVAGIVFAIARDMSLAAYLTQLFLPSVPAYVAAGDLASLHRRGGAARRHHSEQIDDLLTRYRPDGTLTVDHCRRIQDNLYVLRRDYPGVPTWYYRLRQPRDDAATTAGVQALRKDLA